MVWILVAFAFTSAVVQYSFRNGRLVLPPAYDDIGYFADAVMRLNIFYARGLYPVLQQYVSSPPHAPYSTVMAMLGFTIFGIRDWAPYAINGLLLMAYMAAADHFLRGLRPWQKGLGFAVLLSIPLTVMSVHEFRPDHASSLLTVVGGFLILEKPLVTASRRRAAFIGLLFGLALLAKPSTCPATVAILLGTLALGSAADMLITRRMPLLRAAKTCGISILVTLLVALPHYALAYGEIYTYIFDNIFGYKAGIWKTTGSKLYLLTYYVDPSPSNFGGGQMLGRHVFLIAATAVLGAVVTLLNPTRKSVIRAAAFALFVFGAYVVVTTNPDKTIFFGLTFQTAAVFLMVVVFRQLMMIQKLRVPRWPWATAFMILAVAIGFFEFRWPRRWSNATAPETLARRKIADGIYQAIVDTNPPPHSVVLIEGIGDINPSLYSYYLARDQFPIEVFTPNDTDHLDVHMAMLDCADLLVLSEPDTMITADFLLGYQVLPALNKFVSESKKWEKIAYFEYPPSHHGIALYKRKHIEYSGWTQSTGLAPREGPFPAQNLPVVYWGLGPATGITFTAPATPAKLALQFRNGQPDEHMQIRLDDRPIYSHTFGTSTEFTSVDVPLDVKPGTQHQLTITYNHWDLGTDLPRSVFVSRIGDFAEVIDLANRHLRRKGSTNTCTLPCTVQSAAVALAEFQRLPPT